MLLQCHQKLGLSQFVIRIAEKILKTVRCLHQSAAINEFGTSLLSCASSNLNYQNCQFAKHQLVVRHLSLGFHLKFDLEQSSSFLPGYKSLQCRFRNL